MEKHLILAVILQILVNFLLIVASKRMLSEFIHPVRAVLGAMAGGIYSAACLLPALTFLRGNVWYGVSLGAVCLVTFGFSREAGKPAAMYCLLRMSVDGLAKAQNQVQTLLWAAIFCGICLLGFYRQKRRFLPVELCCGENRAHLQGLVDTGHSLRDPVTGSQVLIVGADVAQTLTGLSPQQLADPVRSMGKLPGLRLIPYKTVGKSQGMLLAMQMPNGKIGNRTGNILVAFSPQVLDESGKFQALIGGNV